MGALKSELSMLASRPSSLIVVYRYLSLGSAVCQCFGKSDSRPYQRDGAPRYPSSLIRDLDRDILTALDDDNFDRWEILLIVDTIPLNNSS